MDHFPELKEYIYIYIYIYIYRHIFLCLPVVGRNEKRKLMNERWRNFFSVKQEKENKLYKFIWLRGEENNIFGIYKV